MKEIHPERMARLAGGLKSNCGNSLETAVFIQTCSIAGGMIGLAFGGVGASVGSLLGAMACHFGCHS